MIDIIEERLNDEFIKKEIEPYLAEFASKCLKLGKKYNHSIIVTLNVINSNTGSQMNFVRSFKNERKL